MTAEYKVVVSPTRDGWRYMVRARQSPRMPWCDFAPFRTFTSRIEAEDYMEGLE